MFQRLNNHRFWETAHCIIVEMGGVPTRATRRFIRRLSDKQDFRSTALSTATPTASPISTARSRSGSGNAAHINRFFCVPQARFLGVTPQDIVDFGLEDATHH